MYMNIFPLSVISWYWLVIAEFTVNVINIVSVANLCDFSSVLLFYLDGVRESVNLKALNYVLDYYPH